MKHSLLLVAIALCAVSASADDYQDLTAAKKSDFLWNKINEDHTPGSWPSTLSLAYLFIEGMDVSFDTVSDFMPSGRDKLIHSVSVILKATWKPEPNIPYTGLFQGAEYGFVRISFAAEPSDDQINPGASFKFLRTGKPSGNIFSLYNLGGQEKGDLDYFRHNLTNHPALPAHPGLVDKALQAKFGTASDWPTMLGLSSFAKYDESGAESKPVFPFEVIFSPAAELTKDFAKEPVNKDFQGAMLRHIHKDQTIFTVYCRPSPNSLPAKCGSIVATSDPTPSAFSDAGLFFQHTRMEDDFAIHPEWKEELALMDRTEIDGKIEYIVRQ